MKDKWWESITSVLAVLWSFFIFTVIIIILTKEIKADDKTSYLILTNMTNIALLILGYFYVASKSLNDKMKSESQIQKDSQSTKQITSTETIITPKPEPTITDEMNKQLTDLGYTTEAISKLTFDQATDIIKNLTPP